MEIIVSLIALLELTQYQQTVVVILALASVWSVKTLIVVLFVLAIQYLIKVFVYLLVRKVTMLILHLILLLNHIHARCAVQDVAVAMDHLNISAQVVLKDFTSY